MGAWIVKVWLCVVDQTDVQLGNGMNVPGRIQPAKKTSNPTAKAADRPSPAPFTESRPPSHVPRFYRFVAPRHLCAPRTGGPEQTPQRVVQCLRHTERVGEQVVSCGRYVPFFSCGPFHSLLGWHCRLFLGDCRDWRCGIMGVPWAESLGTVE